MSRPIVSVSGIRGVVGESLDPTTLTRFATAFGTLVACQKVVLGKDSRTSGEMVHHAVLAGLLATGCRVVDVGLCPTPTALLMSKQLNANGSVVITASHNPVEWNGLEFAGEAGQLLTQTERERLIEIYESEDFRLVAWDKQGTIETFDGAIDRHIAAILDCEWLDIDRSRKRALKVVIDAGNGAGSFISPRLLRTLGCQVVEINCTPDGHFPRSAEPTPDALSRLCETVVSAGYDVGFAHDGDADRLVMVSETGVPLSSEYTFAFVAAFLLNKRRYDLVGTVSTSRMLDDIATRHGVQFHRTPVGVGFVVEKMQTLEGSIGGEGTGGVIYPELQYTTDGIASIAAIIQVLVETNMTVSQLVSSMPSYVMHKQKLEVDSQQVADAVIQLALQTYQEAPQGRGEVPMLDLTDGVKRVWSDRWVNIRKSGTEPVIRVFSEATTAEQAETLCQTTIETLEALMRKALH